MSPPLDPRRLDDVEDRELVAAANRGDRAALAALYERYRGWILSLAERFTGDPEIAGDVLQETITWLLGRFPGFELRARMTTVLYPVVRHLAISLQQRARRDRPRGWLPDEPVGAAEPTAERDETLAGLARVIDALPVSHREVLLLRYVDGLSLAEIATAVGVPPGTVKSRLHHALAALRESDLRETFFFE